MGRFVKMAGLDVNDREPDVVLSAPTAQRIANMDFFLKHDVPAVRQFEFQTDQLVSLRDKIIVTAGRTSRGKMPHRCAEALAKLLNRHIVELAGGHVGYLTHPQAFSKELHKLLSGENEV